MDLGFFCFSCMCVFVWVYVPCIYISVCVCDNPFDCFFPFPLLECCLCVYHRRIDFSLVGWLAGGAAAGASATADDGSTALVSLTFFAFELEKVGKSFHRDIFSSSSSLDFHDFHDFWFFAICTAICHKIILILSNSKATVIIYYNYIHLLYLLVN